LRLFAAPRLLAALRRCALPVLALMASAAPAQDYARQQLQDMVSKHLSAESIRSEMR